MAVFLDVEGGNYDGSLGWAPDIFADPSLVGTWIYGSAWGNPNGFDYTFDGADSVNTGGGIQPRYADFSVSGRYQTMPIAIDDLDTSDGITMCAIFRPTATGSPRLFSNWISNLNSDVQITMTTSQYMARWASDELVAGGGALRTDVAQIGISMGAAYLSNIHCLFATFLAGSQIKLAYRHGTTKLNSTIATPNTKYGEPGALFRTAATSSVSHHYCDAMWRRALAFDAIDAEFARIQAFYAGFEIYI